MSTEKLPKPIACPACGQFWTTDASKRDQLCIECSRPISNEAYLRRRYEGLDRVGLGLEEAQTRFLEATRRHFSR
jgi:hypothetical protein